MTHIIELNSLWNIYMHISTSRKCSKCSQKSAFSTNEEDWLNDTQASLAIVLGNPNQRDHCSYEKKQLNRLKNIEAWRTTGVWSDIAGNNKSKQTRTVSDVKHREMSCHTCTGSSTQFSEFCILGLTGNYFCWTNGFQLWNGVLFPGWQCFQRTDFGFQLAVLAKTTGKSDTLVM